MTKEEAISKVKRYLTDYLPSDNYEEVEEIVKTLEQGSTTKNDLAVDFETQREFSGEFQNNLLDLFKLCYKNHTDSCTVTFEYPNAVMEIDFTFRAEREDKD